MTDPIVSSSTSARQTITDSTWQKVTDLDLGKVKVRLMDPKKHNMGVMDAERAINNFKRFFFLSGVEGSPVVPTEEVDKVWHEYLLFTSEYNNTCNFLFNRFIHHQPSLGTAEEANIMNKAVERTKQLYIKHFGPDILRTIYSAAECCDGGNGCHSCSNASCCSTDGGGGGGEG